MQSAAKPLFHTCIHGERVKLDDSWFIKNRHRLLQPCQHPAAAPRHAHIARSVLESSRLAGEVAPHTEIALSRLAPRHRGATRAHMQFYRAALEVIGFLPSDAIVNSAVQIEWLWYTTPFKPFYRDHLGHVMKVALTGLELLENRESPFAQNDEPLIERVARDMASGTKDSATLRMAARRCGIREGDITSESFWRSAVLETVRIAGLLHDLAYPDVMAAKVERAAKPVRPRASFEPTVDETCRHAVEMFQSHLLASPFHQGKLPGRQGLSKEAFDIAAEVFLESHSLRGGYALLQMLDVARRSGPITPFDAFVTEWAALATSMHDYDKFYGKKTSDTLRAWLDDGKNRQFIRPSFAEDPASFIVALADQLQDFGRMSYDGDASMHSDFASSRVRYPCRAVKLEKIGETCAITFELDDMKADASFGPANEDAIKKFAKTKHSEPAFQGTNKGTAWLRPGQLYTDVNIRVVYGGKEYNANGVLVPS